MASTDTITVRTKPCMFCGNPAVIELTAEESAAMGRERFIQDALPTRSPAFRELLISGTHEHCWEAAFGGEDEED